AYGQDFTSSFQIKRELPVNSAISTPSFGSGLILDDIRIYEAINDIQLLRIDTPLNLNCGLGNAVPIKVALRNSSNNDLSNIPIKYSLNNGAVFQDIIATIPANTTIIHTFSTTINLSANTAYSFKAYVDFPGDNYRINDTLTTTLHNAPLVNSFPYLQDFESGDGGWYATGKNSSWQYGTPASTTINKAASGNKVWKTGIAGNYNDNELSYLYSPCLDVSSFTHPMLSLSLALNIENCGSSLCDAAWMEYSTDNQTWNRLSDSTNSGTNWYKKTSTDYVWNQQTYNRWHVATIPLPKGASNLRLRFVMFSDEAVNLEGIALDDVHIYDSVSSIYAGATPSVIITQNVSGNDWVHFKDGDQLIASIHPNGQNLGATDVQGYIHAGTVRYAENQYYLNRNITIKPDNTNLTDSAIVRYYFLDSESEALLSASGCGTCSRPVSAFELGVPKYSDGVDAKENGTISDNSATNWLFITSDNVKKVPFQKGYYAEFKVKDFSEFWLSRGSLQPAVSLPVTLLNFTAQKEKEVAFLQWKTTAEKDIVYYEVEVAKNAEQVRSGTFTPLARLMAKGNNLQGDQLYSYKDLTPVKAGTYYYRLRIVETNGTFSFSPVRSLVFAQPENWLVYPNPSSHFFHLVYQLQAGEKLEASVYDSKGLLIRQYKQTSTGQMQKLTIDLQTIASGVYLLQVDSNNEKRMYKLYKQ
ncbi:MAG TPA: T9SS type A sorting domain-containing protein, partial [Flavisolibacter sp.]|nr:T9SS type A sorting domain-containing protein [Flavisolibacter sp.]